MADNILVSPGSGPPIRVLAEAGGVEWPAGVIAYATTVSAGANVLQVVMPAFPLPVGGGVASGAADAGNPVKVGGVYHAAPPTFTDGQRGDLQLDASGSVKVAVVSGGGSGSNAAAGATGSAVPAQADFAGLNVGGTLRGRTGVNPSGTVYAAQTDVTSVGGVTFALGQQLAAASLPVVLTAAQLAALTPLTTVGITGTVAVTGTVGLSAGAAVIGHVIVDTAPSTAVTGTFWQATQPVSLSPATTGGLSTFSAISAATTNATNVKASAGQLFGYSIDNTTGSALYVKLYDSATAPTAGSGTPVRRLVIPAGGGRERTIPNGLQFSNGIGFTITGASPDNDTTAVTLGAIIINLDYK